MGLAAYGGGASGCTLNNCTVTGNLAVGHYGPINNGGGGVVYDGGSFGGGVYGCELSNCILYYNSPSNYALYALLILNYCCVPLPTGGLGNNITNAPLFVDSPGHLQSNSP